MCEAPYTETVLFNAFYQSSQHTPKHWLIFPLSPGPSSGGVPYDIPSACIWDGEQHVTL